MPSQPNAISLVPFGGSSGRDCCSALEHRATAPEAPRGWGPIPNLLRGGGGAAPDEQMLVPRSEAAPRGSGVRHKSCKDLCRTALVQEALVGGRLAAARLLTPLDHAKMRGRGPKFGGAARDPKVAKLEKDPARRRRIAGTEEVPCQHAA